MPSPTVAIGGASLIQGQRASRDARRANANSLALSREQLAFEKDRDLYKRGLVDDMLADADYSDAEYENAVGAASTDVTQSFDKSRGMESRAISRMGINPNSGRFSAMSKGIMLDQAAKDANARNKTRLGMRSEEKSRRHSARSAGLGVQSNTGNVLGSMAERANNDATSYNNASSSAYSSGLATLGLMTGMNTTPTNNANSPVTPVYSPTPDQGLYDSTGSYEL